MKKRRTGPTKKMKQKPLGKLHVVFAVVVDRHHRSVAVVAVAECRNHLCQQSLGAPLLLSLMMSTVLTSHRLRCCRWFGSQPKDKFQHSSQTVRRYLLSRRRKVNNKLAAVAEVVEQINGNQ